MTSGANGAHAGSRRPGTDPLPVEVNGGPNRMNRSQRRRVETHNRLFAALRTEIAASGLGELTVQAVTERADVALGTFYNHFEHKNTAIEALSALEFSVLKLACESVEGYSDQIPRLISTSISLLVQRGFEDRQWVRYMGELADFGWWPGAAGRMQYMSRSTDANQRGLIAVSDARWAASAIDGLLARIITHVRDADHSSSPSAFVADSTRTVLGALGVPPDAVIHEIAFTRTIPNITRWPEAAHLSLANP